MFALFLFTSLSSHSSSTVKLRSRYFKHEDQKLFKGKRQTEEEYLPGCPFPATDIYLFLVCPFYPFLAEAPPSDPHV